MLYCLLFFSIRFKLHLIFLILRNVYTNFKIFWFLVNAMNMKFVELCHIEKF